MTSKKIALLDTGAGQPDRTAVAAAVPDANVVTGRLPQLALADGSVACAIASLPTAPDAEQLSELLRPVAVGGHLLLLGTAAARAAAATALPETESDTSEADATVTALSTALQQHGELLILRRTGRRHDGSCGCIICGRENTVGLRWQYWQSGHRAWASGPIPVHLAGFADVVHGGIVAAVLDDALWYATHAATGEVTFTAELTIRYRRPAPVGAVLTAAGEFTGNRRRILLAEGRLWGPDGDVLATATGRFLSGGDELRERLQRS